MIMQGDRDPFGTRQEVEGMTPLAADRHHLGAGR